MIDAPNGHVVAPSYDCFAHKPHLRYLTASVTLRMNFRLFHNIQKCNSHETEDTNLRAPSIKIVYFTLHTKENRTF